MEEEEQEVWKSPAWLYPCILGTTGVLIFYRGRSLAKERDKTAAPFLATFLPTAFLSLQRRFLSVFLLAVGAESLQLVYGESLLQNKGLKREEMAFYFAFSHLASLFLGTFLGILTDLIGRKKACVAYCFMQVVISLAKKFASPLALWITSISQGIATSLLASAFETWMVVEHEKLGFRQEWMSDTFWLMSFGAAVVAIGSAAIGNFSLTWQSMGLSAPAVAAAGASGLAAIGVMLMWEESSLTSHAKFWGFTRSVLQTLNDKKLIALGWTHACFDFASVVFWFLWTPTLVADGRELHSGMIYACLLASEMLGSAIAAMLLCGPWNVRPEDFLRWVIICAAIALLVPAYDYQEIGVLVSAFCIFHICYGISWPFLARLRSVYVPSDQRATIITIFRAPMNAAAVFILISGSRRRQLENSSIFGLSILGLLSGVCCLHLLNRWRQVSHDKIVTERP